MNSERGNRREPREEESRILGRTRHLRTDQRRLASACNRLLSTASGCSSAMYPSSLFSFFLAFCFFPEAGLKFNAGRCASLRNPEWCRCCKPTKLGKPPSESPPLTHRTNLPRRQRAPAHRLSERRLIGRGFRANAMGTRVDGRFTGLEMRSVSGKGAGRELRPCSDCVKCCKQDPKAGQKKFGEARENRKLEMN